VHISGNPSKVVNFGRIAVAGHRVKSLRRALACVVAALLMSGCGRDDAGTESPPAEDEPAWVDSATSSPGVMEALPEQFLDVWEPWFGDLDGMVERRKIRVLVPFGGYQFYYVDGQPRGAMVELLHKLESFLNKELDRRHIRVFVIPVPVSRDYLVPYLLQGHADLVAADLTVTAERAKLVHFSRPLLTGINEVIVTGPTAPALTDLDDLAGHEIVVRRSSSYYEHLDRLSARMRESGIEPPLIVPADELLEAEDLLAMAANGLIPMTVLDDYKAEFWATVFDGLTVRTDLPINEDGRIAWAMRPDATALADFVDRFLRLYGRGTMVGNDTFNRYLADANDVRCAMTYETLTRNTELARWLKTWGEEYGFDWLKLAAQGYQESRLDQSKRSPAGAVGVMQIKPSTAADPNVGIDDVTVLENNIEAAAKYMRFLTDRYFADVDELNRWLFGLAAYNAGPARVAKLRRETGQNGLDPARWFGNVEIAAARRIGRETVRYVSNVYTYYMGYKMSEARLIERRTRYGTSLNDCPAGGEAAGR